MTPMPPPNESNVRTTDLGIDGLSGAVHLGSGGSANVFAARQLDTGEQVAVKLLRASADSDKERTRFEREQETLRALASQDGIVPVLDAGLTDRGEPYFLMPLMEGSLQDRVDNDGPLDWQTATQLIVEVADTVEFAHSQQVLHRDLKPGNILLDEGGVPRVADFGIAKLLDSSVSKSSKSLGTPSFMPPERFNGQDATAASDVYGLAATLSALITGSAPFLTGENDTDAAVMMRVINEAPPSLAGHGVPDEVVAAVQAAMSKDPSKRPQTASEFASSLRVALGPHLDSALAGPVTVAIARRNITIPDGPVTSPKGATIDLGTQEPAPKRKWLALLAAALFAVIVGGGAALALSGNDKPETEVAGKVETAARDDLKTGGADDDSNADADVDGGTVGDELVDGGDGPTVPSGAAGEDEGEDNSSLGLQADTGDDNQNSEKPGNAERPGTTQAPTTSERPGTTQTTSTTQRPATTQTTKTTERPGTTHTTTTTKAPIAAPIACFNPSATSVETGQRVTFTNCSSNANSYSWDLAGSTSRETSPWTSWTTAGNKRIELTATGAGGSHTEIKWITITKTNVVDPKLVPQHINCTTLGPAEWSWTWSTLPSWVDDYLVEFSGGSTTSVGRQPSAYRTTKKVTRIIAVKDGNWSPANVPACAEYDPAEPDPPSGVSCRFSNFRYVGSLWTWTETWSWTDDPSVDHYEVLVNVNGSNSSMGAGRGTYTTDPSNGQPNSGYSVKQIIAIDAAGKSAVRGVSPCGNEGGSGWKNPT